MRCCAALGGKKEWETEVPFFLSNEKDKHKIGLVVGGGGGTWVMGDEWWLVLVSVWGGG